MARAHCSACVVDQTGIVLLCPAHDRMGRENAELLAALRELVFNFEDNRDTSLWIRMQAGMPAARALIERIGGDQR